MKTALELRVVLGILVGVQALTAIAGITALERVGTQAGGLGGTASWTLAILALLGFGVTAAGLGRFRRRLLLPLREIDVVLTARRSGDEHRRCARLPDSELADVLAGINELLDQAGGVRHGPPKPDREDAAGPTDNDVLRAAVVGLLDRDGEPLVLWREPPPSDEPDDESNDSRAGDGRADRAPGPAPAGHLVAVSRSAHERLGGDGKEHLDAIRRGAVDPVDRFENLPEGGALVLYRV